MNLIMKYRCEMESLENGGGRRCENQATKLVVDEDHSIPVRDEHYVAMQTDPDFKNLKF
jgi:hypothetical protein